MKGKRLVLLINLGTPHSYRPRDVFRYLTEFLTDKRVMDLPWWKRQLLVRGLIIPGRFIESARQYRAIWTSEGSPLWVHGKKLQQQLQDRLGEAYHVALAMRYQTPSIREVLKQWQQRAIEELILLPLFPQYASATTGSVLQEVFATIGQWHTIPATRCIARYADHPRLIEAFSEQIRHSSVASYDHLLFSFHGLPKRQEANALAPTYRQQCEQMTSLIAERLQLSPNQYTVCFQSRLGREPWLSPYLSDVISSCGKKGDKRLLVVAPSFVCDCLETTYEIGHECRKQFLKQGGEVLSLVPGLNDHPLWIETLCELIQGPSLSVQYSE